MMIEMDTRNAVEALKKLIREYDGMKETVDTISYIYYLLPVDVRSKFRYDIIDIKRNFSRLKLLKLKQRKRQCEFCRFYSIYNRYCILTKKHVNESNSCESFVIIKGLSK